MTTIITDTILKKFNELDQQANDARHRIKEAKKIIDDQEYRLTLIEPQFTACHDYLKENGIRTVHDFTKEDAQKEITRKMLAMTKEQNG